MDITVYDSNYVAVGLVDDIYSIIWVERYRSPGYFELYTKYRKPLEDLLKRDYFLSIPGSRRSMIIEDVEIKSDRSDDGNKLVVTGRTLESILERRIVTAQWLFTGNLQTNVIVLILNNIIEPTDTTRIIPNWAWGSSPDAGISTLTMEAQFYTQNLLDVIQSICEKENIGFEVVYDSTNKFRFTLRNGVDRSYSQTSLPYVVFSPNFDNLVRGSYFKSNSSLRTYAMVMGDRTTGNPEIRNVFAGSPTLSGLSRRELFVDASDLSRYLAGTTTEIPLADYQAQLDQRGKEVLAENVELTVLDGEVSLTDTYIYDADFKLGDYVQIVDEYGHSAKAQILEMTFSESPSGSATYPTLKSV